MNVIAAMCEINGAHFVVVSSLHTVTSDETKAKIALAQARYLFPDTSCILLSKSPEGKAHIYGPKILRDILQRTDLNSLPWAKYKIKEETLKKLRPLKMESKANDK